MEVTLLVWKHSIHYSIDYWA